jgi:membrane protein YqaA with SNARE-associated domain
MANIAAVIIAAVAGIIGLVFVGVLLATVLGGVVGWIVGLFFPEIIASLNSIMGLSLSNFEMGAMLGFVGGFFRSTLRTESK